MPGINSPGLAARTWHSWRQGALPTLPGEVDEHLSDAVVFPGRRAVVSVGSGGAAEPFSPHRDCSNVQMLDLVDEARAAPAGKETIHNLGSRFLLFVCQIWQSFSTSSNNVTFSVDFWEIDRPPAMVRN